MKKILFVCVGNSCRSQMAEGFARHYGKGKINATSAGTQPADKINSKAAEVMKEKGIDISGQTPKLLTAKMTKSADLVVSMGCGVEESCPASLQKNMIDWGLEDPYGQSLEKYREIRDLIEKKVKELLNRIQ
jgi:arsenate reductase